MCFGIGPRIINWLRVPIALTLSYIGDRVPVLKPLNRVSYGAVSEVEYQDPQHHCGNKRVRRLGFNCKLSKVDQF